MYAGDFPEITPSSGSNNKFLQFLIPLPPSSQLHCVHFGSWDSNRDWSVSLTAKESIRSVAVGDGWIAIATNKQMLRLFSVGGVQQEVISVPGRPVTLSGWGGRLAIIYQAGPCKLRFVHTFSYSLIPRPYSSIFVHADII